MNEETGGSQVLGAMLRRVQSDIDLLKNEAAALRLCLSALEGRFGGMEGRLSAIENSLSLLAEAFAARGDRQQQAFDRIEALLREAQK